VGAGIFVYFDEGGVSAVQGHPRSINLVPIGVDFLVVRNSNFGPILHRFGDLTGFMCYLPHPYSTLIFGVFPLHQIAHVGVSQSRGLKLFG